ncbi:putative quinol monooxygenase [Serratia aquatilis]|uniref:Quinol monooxygenase n=1 Tax=Serratia aquatilis TaxID=1737515 RepID=A0ABV6EBJ2_9GAMM
MSEVKVVALIKANPEHRAAVDKAVRAMVAPSRSEPGCIQYDLHEEQGHPGAFVFIERWTSEQALKEHMAMPYHDAFLAELEGKLVSLEVKKLTQL